MRDSVFVFNMISASLLIIYIFVFTSIIGQLIYPYGLESELFVEKIGLSLQSVGIVGGILSAIVLSFYPYLMLTNYLVVGLSFVSSIFFYLAMQSANETLLLVSCALMGFVAFPIFMVAYELAVE